MEVHMREMTRPVRSGRTKKMKERREALRTMEKWFLIFLAFGFIGWIYEVAIMWLEMHQGFVNRGFLLGPCLPLYGIGGLVIVLIAGRFRKRPLICFLVICLMTTGTELLASYLMEWWMGKFLWNYQNTGFGPTFQGRIALRSSLQFGLIGMAAVYIFYPLLDGLIRVTREKLPRTYRVITYALFVVFVIDVGFHLIHGSNARW